MAHYPLVVAQIGQYPTAPQMNTGRVGDRHVIADTLDQAIRAAIREATIHFDTGWFWFRDSRYSPIADLDELEGALAPDSPMVLGALNVAKGDPFDNFGGLYLLPTLDVIRLQDFYHWSYGGNTRKRLDLEKPVTDWPFTLVPTVASIRRPAYSTFVLRYDEPHFTKDLLTAAHPLSIPRPLVYEYQAHSPIYESHRAIAGLSETQNFWVFDADFLPDPFLQLVQETELWEEETDYVHLWHARNPINGLEYGHGGPKLFNRAHFLTQEKREGPDTTLSVGKGLTVHEECVGVHKFNWSPFSTWRTALREAVKLFRSDTAESLYRLDVWTDVNRQDYTVDYASYCLHGAKTGVKLAESRVHTGKEEWINDYSFLRTLFNQEFPSGTGTNY